MSETPRDVAGKAAHYFERLRHSIERIDNDAFDAAIALIKSAWADERQIIVFGNGGSALTAQHFVADWNKGIYTTTGRRFRGVCLSESMAQVSAYANDISYGDVFLEQLKPVLAPSDLVIGISGSGNSKNVVRAIEFANDNGGITLGICGYDGGMLRKRARHAICSDVHDMQLSEDIHLAFGHMTMQSLCGSVR